MSEKVQLDIGILYKKLKKLTSADLLDLLVSALEKPVTELEFSSDGYTYEGKCYGGPATNLIAKMFDIEDPSKHVSWGLPKEKLKKSFVVPMYTGFQVDRLWGDHWQILSFFSGAIDVLAQGRINTYNFYISLLDGLSHLTIPDEDYKLTRLTEETYMNHLDEYTEFANVLRS